MLSVHPSTVKYRINRIVITIMIHTMTDSVLKSLFHNINQIRSKKFSKDAGTSVW